MNQLEKEFETWIVDEVGIQDAAIFTKGTQVRNVALKFAQFQVNKNLPKQKHTSKLAEQFKSEGYTPHFNTLDSTTVAEEKCIKCICQPVYIGLYHIEKGIYRAISFCPECGNEYEF